MGGEIKVVKKNGPGTLMRLYLLLNTPTDGTGQHCHPNLAEQTTTVSKNILHPTCVYADKFSQVGMLEKHFSFDKCRCCLH